MTALEQKKRSEEQLELPLLSDREVWNPDEDQFNSVKFMVSRPAAGILRARPLLIRAQSRRHGLGRGY